MVSPRIRKSFYGTGADANQIIYLPRVDFNRYSIIELIRSRNSYFIYIESTVRFNSKLLENISEMVGQMSGTTQFKVDKSSYLVNGSQLSNWLDRLTA